MRQRKLLPRPFLRTKFDRLMTRLPGIINKAPARWLQAGLFALAIAFISAPNAAMAGEEPSALTRSLGLRTVVPEAPDFVAKTRNPSQGFIPVHSPRAKPTGTPMVKDQVAKTEKSLDSARKRQDRLAGRVSAPIGKSVADSMEAKDAKPKAARPACGLTCPSPGLLPARPGKEAQ